MFKTRFVSEDKLKDIRLIISKITDFKPGDENFKKCENYFVSKLYNNREIEPYIGDIKKSMNGMIEKLQLHAHYSRADNLKNSVNSLNEMFPDKDDLHFVYQTLHFLMEMSSRPARDSPVEIIDPDYSLSEQSVEIPFDWDAYLKEGIEIDPAIGQDSSDESIWSDVDEIKSQSSVSISPAPEEEEEEVVSSMEVKEDEDESGPVRNVEAEMLDTMIGMVNDAWRAKEPGYRTKHTDPLPQFPSSTLINYWVDKTGQSVRVLSEYIVIREILWALSFPEACHLVFNKRGSDFTVLPDVAVCSLTPKAVQSMLETYCPVLKAIEEMKIFINDLNTSTNSPSTYKAYACALNIIFKNHCLKLCEIERRVMKQNSINTIHTITMELEPTMKYLLELYSVHCKVISDWTLENPWMCAIKLLSNLASHVRFASNLEILAALFSLLLRSLKPYLDITEKWLMSGNLYDPLNEYLIYQIVDEETRMIKYEPRPFIESLQSENIKPLEFLEVLLKFGKTIGRSIQLLKGFHAINKLQISSDNQDSLYDSMIKEVKSKLIPVNNKIEEREVLAEETSELTNKKDEREVVEEISELEENAIQYFRQKCDDDLSIVFANTLGIELGEEFNKSIFKYPTEELLIKTDEISFAQPVGALLATAFTDLIKDKVDRLGSIAQELLHQKCCIEFHLSALKSVYLLQAGPDMHQFFSYIINQIRENDDWRKWGTWYLLTNQLQASLSQDHLESSHLFILGLLDKCEITEISEITEGFPLMQFLNHLEISYNMDWPVTLVIHPENISKYNRIFRFLAKFKCALLSLQQLDFQDLKHERLVFLRSWLIFTLGTILEHLFAHIFTTLAVQLDTEINEAKDIESALNAHDSFVEKVHNLCLFDKKTIAAHKTIMELIALAMSVVYAWSNTELTEKNINSLEDDYTKLHTFFTLWFNTLAGTNVHLAGIAAALNDSYPKFY